MPLDPVTARVRANRHEVPAKTRLRAENVSVLFGGDLDSVEVVTVALAEFKVDRLGDGVIENFSVRLHGRKFSTYRQVCNRDFDSLPSVLSSI